MEKHEWWKNIWDVISNVIGINQWNLQEHACVSNKKWSSWIYICSISWGYHSQNKSWVVILTKMDKLSDLGYLDHSDPMEHGNQQRKWWIWSIKLDHFVQTLRCRILSIRLTALMFCKSTKAVRWQMTAQCSMTPQSLLRARQTKHLLQ